MINLDTFNPGHFETGYEYKFFLPEKVNTDWTWNDQTINELLEKAAVKLGELNSYALLVPDIDLFIQLHVTKEAVQSSRIEGTAPTSMKQLCRRMRLSRSAEMTGVKSIIISGH